MRPAQSLVLIALLAAVAALPAQAHHEVGGYDQNHPVVLDGLVREFVWANPHVLLYVEVPNGNASKDEWTLEGGSVQALEHRGWTRKSLRPGDSVHVLVAPLLDGKHAGKILRLVQGNGRELTVGP